jgi:hypothetical protein
LLRASRKERVLGAAQRIATETAQIKTRTERLVKVFAKGARRACALRS